MYCVLFLCTCKITCDLLYRCTNLTFFRLFATKSLVMFSTRSEPVLSCSIVQLCGRLLFRRIHSVASLPPCATSCSVVDQQFVKLPKSSSQAQHPHSLRPSTHPRSSTVLNIITYDERIHLLTDNCSP